MYGCSDERSENGDGEEGSYITGGEDRGYLAYMQMTWFHVVSQRKT